MHSGCDKFIEGFIGETDFAGLYIESEGLYGQFILDGTIMEANRGFVIFMKLAGRAAMTFNPLELRNVWMEFNSTSDTVCIFWTMLTHHSGPC